MAIEYRVLLNLKWSTYFHWNGQNSIKPIGKQNRLVKQWTLTLLSDILTGSFPPQEILQTNEQKLPCHSGSPSFSIGMRVIWSFLIMCENTNKGLFKRNWPEFYRRSKRNGIVNSSHMYLISIFFFNWFDSLINIEDMGNYKSRNLTYVQLLYTCLWRCFSAHARTGIFA